MAWTPISGTVPQYSNSANGLANDYWLKFYDLTMTPIDVAIDSAGTDPKSKIKLNAEGYPITNPLDDSTTFIPYADQDYRIVLYRTEADADADNTVNAAFNVDGVTTDIPQLANASEIEMRDTTLLIQDYYDRSRLFIDGDGFTAGAGPHVITTPTEWTPNNADVTFYRKDNSGIITELTPTSKDSTTFTLAETLLSTDEIFLGDDRFRNQFDGDPKGIRSRIDTYSTTEIDTADNLRLEKADNLASLASAATSRTNIDVYSTTEVDNGIDTATTPPVVSGFVGAKFIYTVDDSSPEPELNSSGSIAESTWVSIGPTGSGATIIWTALDSIPSGHVFIDTLMRIRELDSVAGLRGFSVAVRPGGSTASADESTLVMEASAKDIEDLGYMTSPIRIPVDSNGVFEIFYAGSSGPTFRMRLRGFGV